jgi:hypothetical protein
MRYTALMRALASLLGLILMCAVLGGCGSRHTLPAVDIDAHAPKLRYGMTEAEVIGLIGSKPVLSDERDGVKVLNYLDAKNRSRFLEMVFHGDKLTSAKFDVEVDVPKDRDRDLFRTERRIDLPGDPDLAPQTAPTGSLPSGLDR